jgi:CspA family cold shock protein
LIRRRGEPLDLPGTKLTGHGVVKKFSPQLGWGSIKSADSPWEIWVHFSAIEGDGYRQLKKGQAVTVDFERANQDGYKYAATKVRVHPEGEPYN